MARNRRKAVEKQQRIFEALLEGGGTPLTAYEIHKKTGLRMNALHYHLPALVRGGILVPYDGGRYALQKIYYDARARQSLDVALELITMILATQNVWDFVDREAQDEFSVVTSNLEYYLRWLKEPE